MIGVNKVAIVWAKVSSLESVYGVLVPARRSALMVLKAAALGLPMPAVKDTATCRIMEVWERGVPELLALIAVDQLRLETARKCCATFTIESLAELADSENPQKAFTAALKSAQPDHYREHRRSKRKPFRPRVLLAS